MKPEDFVRALHGDKPIFGTCILSTSPQFPLAAKASGCDFVFIDTEHVPIDRAQLSWMCRTYAAMDLPPLVRVMEPEPYRASSYLDGGAAGIIFPYCETVQQIKSLVGATKYRPMKGRQLARALEGDREDEDGVVYGDKGLTDALRKELAEMNERTACVVNIESVAAIERLDELLDIPGIDAILVGPHDLSISLGIPRQWKHPEFHTAIELIITKARSKGLGAGVHYSDHETAIEYQEKWMRQGANLVIHASDVVAFTNAMTTDLNRLKLAAGLKQEAVVDLHN